MKGKDGIISIDKPAGITSHDVVDKLRRILKIKRIGHTGILDPSATGLMIMLVGRGTLFSSFLTRLSKRYVARFAFGKSTDTFDSDGRELSRHDPGKLRKEEFQSLLDDYRGPVEQLIPPFSAAKRNGIALHRRARKGETFTPGKKVVEIKSIELLEYDWPDVVLDIRCSSGTYLRSMAHQIGERIGCGGYLKALRRIEVGPFCVSHAVSIDQLEESPNPREFIKPLKEAMSFYQAVRVKPEYYGAILNGRPLMKRYIEGASCNGKEGQLSLLLGPGENVLALAELNLQCGSFQALGPSQIVGRYVRIIDEGHIRTR